MTTLTLLQLNDLHGYLEPHPELVRTEGGWRFERLGGVARIAPRVAPPPGARGGRGPGNRGPRPGPPGGRAPPGGAGG
ncbi:hypothetical protein, partial [Brevundimonas sp.]|uniref:hypothetical protein n=1 Tax=Brevundimonas sp. TaxID=1871086 RepID=UPI0025BAC176